MHAEWWGAGCVPPCGFCVRFVLMPKPDERCWARLCPSRTVTGSGRQGTEEVGGQCFQCADSYLHTFARHLSAETTVNLQFSAMRFRRIV